jgi:putative Holliday junction resolvase
MPGSAPRPGGAQRGGVLAIDHGAKRTGFAVADPLRIVVQPLDVWHGDGASDALLDEIARLLGERDVATLLVGLPLNMDGSEGGQAAAARAFARRLAERFAPLEVVTWDERLTTHEALDLLRQAGHHGAARKARRDAWSAWVLLRDWIESGERRA